MLKVVARFGGQRVIVCKVLQAPLPEVEDQVFLRMVDGIRQRCQQQAKFELKF